jgi:hypothetical protein
MRPVLLILLLSCRDTGRLTGDSPIYADPGIDNESEFGSDENEVDADSDSDSDSDSDTDTDSDTDADLDAELDEDDGIIEDTDSEMEGSQCGMNWTAEIRNGTGTVGQSFTEGDPLFVAGLITNPCTEKMTFQTTSECLVSGVHISGSNGTDDSELNWTNSCDPALSTPWELAAGESVEQVTEVGELTADVYTVTLYFADTDGSTAATAVEIIP